MASSANSFLLPSFLPSYSYSPSRRLIDLSTNSNYLRFRHHTHNPIQRKNFVSNSLLRKLNIVPNPQQDPNHIVYTKNFGQKTITWDPKVDYSMICSMNPVFRDLQQFKRKRLQRLLSSGLGWNDQELYKDQPSGELFKISEQDEALALQEHKRKKQQQQANRPVENVPKVDFIQYVNSFIKESARRFALLKARIICILLPKDTFQKKPIFYKLQDFLKQSAMAPVSPQQKIVLRDYNLSVEQLEAYRQVKATIEQDQNGIQSRIRKLNQRIIQFMQNSFGLDQSYVSIEQKEQGNNALEERTQINFGQLLKKSKEIFNFQQGQQGQQYPQQQMGMQNEATRRARQIRELIESIIETFYFTNEQKQFLYQNFTAQQIQLFEVIFEYEIVRQQRQLSVILNVEGQEIEVQVRNYKSLYQKYSDQRKNDQNYVNRQEFLQSLTNFRRALVNGNENQNQNLMINENQIPIENENPIVDQNGNQNLNGNQNEIQDDNDDENDDENMIENDVPDQNHNPNHNENQNPNANPNSNSIPNQVRVSDISFHPPENQNAVDMTFAQMPIEDIVGVNAHQLMQSSSQERATNINRLNQRQQMRLEDMARNKETESILLSSGNGKSENHESFVEPLQPQMAEKFKKSSPEVFKGNEQEKSKKDEKKRK